jgi:S-adenosylmethionine decarboxylase proenzyme
MNKNLTHSVKEYIIDAFDCKQNLADPEIAKESIGILKKAAESAGATVIEIHCTTYTIHGFTTVALLAESHIILTTWPELNYASINIYLCNPEMDHSVVLDNIFNYLQPTNWRSSWFRHLSLPKSNKRIFLAAPFTKYIKKNGFDNSAYVQITSIISLLRELGYSVFSAHEREAFGDKLMTPEICTKLDFKEMNQCDLVVAMIDESSYGVSLELGWASALHKPIILFQKEGQQFSSPLIEGIGVITDSVNVCDIQSLLTAINELECKNQIAVTE